MKDFFFRNIKENFGIKLFSLILSVALWVFVINQQRSETGLTVPLEIRNMREDAIITSITAKYINLRVTGAEFEIRRLTPRQIKVQIDMEGSKLGTSVFNLSEENIQKPKRINISSVSPSTIEVKLEKAVYKSVTIKPVIEGELKEGYRIKSVTLSPNHVEIKGPKSAIKEIREIWTNPIDIAGKSESFERGITLNSPEDLVKPNEGVPIFIKVEVEEIIETRKIGSVQVTAKDSGALVQIKPSTLELTVEGPVHILKTLTEELISATISVKGLKPGSYKKRAEIILPEGIDLVNAKPKWFSVKVLEKKKQ